MSSLTPSLTPSRTCVVTGALPYANGPIHLGHLLEYIQADIFVRSLRRTGAKAYYICADDTHGTAIMLSAQQAGQTPQQWIKEISQAHQHSLKAFNVQFSYYGSTDSEANRQWVYRLYETVQAKQGILTKSVEQLYDPVKGLFLADRHVKGACPRCGEEDQYGDHCESCSATYEASELKNPRSVHSNAAPTLKESLHYFFDLPKFQVPLTHWVNRPDTLQPEVRNKLAQWLDEPLRAWDISRDAPYFGFEIPNESDKFFYVWLDAPVGYIGALQDFEAQGGLEDSDLSTESVWSADSQVEVYHFVGKDITYFHGLFWPALLHAAGLRLPSGLFAHGFLTLDGKKMSKSRGTFIKADDLAKHLPSDALRYYFAARLNGKVEDVDLDLDQLVELVNSDLVGRLANLPSRTMRLLERYQQGQLSASRDETVLEPVRQAAEAIEAAYEARATSLIVRQVADLADGLNAYLNEHEPWRMAKEESTQDRAMVVCSTALEGFSLLVSYLSPIVPDFAQKAAHLLGLNELDTNGEQSTQSFLLKPLQGPLLPFEPLFQRLCAKSLRSALLDDSQKGA